MPKEKPMISRLAIIGQWWGMVVIRAFCVYHLQCFFPIPKTWGQSQSRSLQCQGGNDFILLNWMPDPIKYRWADSGQVPKKSNLKRHLSTFSIELRWVSRIPNMDVIHHLGLGERDWIHWEGLEVVWLECLKIRGRTFAQKRFQWILVPMNCEAHGNRKCCFNMF